MRAPVTTALEMLAVTATYISSFWTMDGPTNGWIDGVDGMGVDGVAGWDGCGGLDGLGWDGMGWDGMDGWVDAMEGWM